MAPRYKEFADFVEGAAAAADFETFKARWERARTGIVLTAHPTFGLSDALSQRMVEIAVADDADPNTRIGVPHRPDETIDLAYEHERAQNAIQNLRNAYVELLDSFFSVAVQRFGDEAYTLRPKLATFASWVGYDLDGRTDIDWSYSFMLRLQEKRAALTDIRERFLGLRNECRRRRGAAHVAPGDRQARPGDRRRRRADRSSRQGDEDRHAARRGGQRHHALRRLQHHDRRADRLAAPVAHRCAPGRQGKRGVAALAGLMQATGLGTAHIHVRINAVQLNNAFRAFVHEPWTRDLSESQALARIVDMIETARSETVNFESLDLETATAIRQFALIAQIQKHVDRETPIRFLIAETRIPATVLIAIFFAKLFGVDQIVDISPLFETPLGLETGARVIERLLEEKAYVDYVKRRKRLALQTGFSDAGRFIGQIAATLAIERLHHGLAEAIQRADLKGVETLIFSTHGESMGRGAHPGELRTRLHYVFSDESRRRFAAPRDSDQARDELPGRRRLPVLRQPRADDARAGDRRHGRRDSGRG